MLNILVIEDSPADFSLLERQLQRQGVAARLQRVDSAEALEAALRDATWDAVLSDYSVPGLDFRERTLELCARLPDVPLILVSGSVGEEQAVDLLKQGVWDFVLKDNLGRLAPSLERALREAAGRRARREAEAALKASEERFKLAMRGANDGLWDQDLKTGKAYLSPRWKSMLGYEDGELEDSFDTWKRLVHADDLEPTLARMNDYLARRAERLEYEFRMLHKDGHHLHILSRGFMLLDADGEPARLVGTHVDITERKEAAERLRESEARLSLALQASRMGVWEWDIGNGRVVRSPECEVIFGGGLLKDTMESFFHAVHPEDRARVAAARDEALSRRHGYTAEYRIVRPDGEVLWLLDVGRGVYDAEGRPTKLTGTVQDITARKAAESELRLAARVFESGAEGVMITDAATRILKVNRAFTQITGYAPAEVLGCTPTVLHSGRHDAIFYQAMWAALNTAGQWRGEIWNRRKDGEAYPEFLTISAVPDEAGRVSNYVAVFTDLSASKAFQENLDFLAHHDPLTGMPNRVLFHARLEHSLQRARRDQRRLALLYVDLDRFKVVNETLGHAAGDELLQAVAGQMRAQVRATDTLARLGGDEFVLLMEDLTDPADAAVTAYKLLQVFANPFTVGRSELYNSASIGISVYPEDGSDAGTLLSNADVAMYQAKNKGRNTYRFFESRMTEGTLERLKLENALRVALVRREFQVYYQPQVSLADGRLLGAEALLRWRHPERGMVPPVDFIPMAEELGLIGDIGAWVLGDVCRQMRAWDTAGFVLPRVAVNLSARQLEEEFLADWVASILEGEGIDPGRIELEVTESMIMREAEHAIAMLNSFRAMGVRLAVDDFGTGYSSLAYLKRLPLHRLKIDRSFVRDVTEDPNDEAIARAIIGMASTLGLEVIAEGVETRAQAMLLAAEGCAEAQGYLFGRPVPADELPRYRPPAQ